MCSTIDSHNTIQAIHPTICVNARQYTNHMCECQAIHQPYVWMPGNTPNHMCECQAIHTQTYLWMSPNASSTNHLMTDSRQVTASSQHTSTCALWQCRFHVLFSHWKWLSVSFQYQCFCTWHIILFEIIYMVVYTLTYKSSIIQNYVLLLVQIYNLYFRSRCRTCTTDLNVQFVFQI